MKAALERRHLAGFEDGGSGCKWKNKKQGQYPEAGKKTDSPWESSEKDVAWPANILIPAQWEPFQASEWQNCKIIDLHCFKPLNWWLSVTAATGNWDIIFQLFHPPLLSNDKNPFTWASSSQTGWGRQAGHSESHFRAFSWLSRDTKYKHHHHPLYMLGSFGMPQPASKDSFQTRCLSEMLVQSNTQPGYVFHQCLLLT